MSNYTESGDDKSQNPSSLESNVSADFNGQQIVNFRIENRTTDPSSPAVGQMWLRTDL